MQPSALPRQEILVDRLLEERVAEGVALLPVDRLGDQDLEADRLAQRLVQRDRVVRRDRREQGRVDPPAGRRCDPEQVVGRLAQPGDVGQEDLAEGRRQLGRAALPDRHEEFLGEERVALGAGVDRVDDGRIEVGAGDRPELSVQLATVEPPQVEPLDPPGPLELGDERQQRVAAVELVGAVGHDEHDARVAQVAHEEREQVAARAVRPMEVLDDHHDRRRRREPLEDPEDQLEQPALLRTEREPTGHRDGQCVDRPEVRDEPCQLRATRAEDRVELLGARRPDPRPERLDDRCVRHATVHEIDAPAGEDAQAVGRGGLGELAQQAGLADARLAGDEEPGASTLACRVECRPQPPELVGPADEHGTRDAGVHRTIIRAASPGVGRIVRLGHVAGASRATSRRSGHRTGTGDRIGRTDFASRCASASRRRSAMCWVAMICCSYVFIWTCLSGSALDLDRSGPKPATGTWRRHREASLDPPLPTLHFGAGRPAGPRTA